MRKIESVMDDMRGQVTYEVAPDRYITLDARVVREHGLAEVMKFYGVKMPTGRLPVFQRGRWIGSLPAAFEPISIKSASFFYDVRPGDFTRTGDGWQAANTLCPGDFESIPGFVWNREAGEQLDRPRMDGREG
jgi:hypothetical protein